MDISEEKSLLLGASRFLGKIYEEAGDALDECANYQLLLDSNPDKARQIMEMLCYTVRRIADCDADRDTLLRRIISFIRTSKKGGTDEQSEP